MARGAQGKLRQRNRKKEKSDAADAFFEESAATQDEKYLTADDILQNPIAAAAAAAVSSDNGPAVETESDEDDLPKQKTNKRKKVLQQKPTTSGSLGGIKKAPLILLIIMTGTTLLPALIYASDYLSSFLAKNNVTGQIGFRLGIGAVPRKRVLSFYEKHAPEKLDDVPGILGQYYGNYNTLIKRLERKYQDYGYFIGWEEDEAPIRLAMDQVKATYDVWIQNYWNRYAPQILKTAARNIRYNLTFLLNKGRRIWKKHLWPVLEPVFGVPAGTEKQKRQDAAEARKRKASAQKTSTRRKNTEFRDDEE